VGKLLNMYGNAMYALRDSFIQQNTEAFSFGKGRLNVFNFTDDGGAPFSVTVSLSRHAIEVIEFSKDVLALGLDFNYLLMEADSPNVAIGKIQVKRREDVKNFMGTDTHAFLLKYMLKQNKIEFVSGGNSPAIKKLDCNLMDMSTYLGKLSIGGEYPSKMLFNLIYDGKLAR